MKKDKIFPVGKLPIKVLEKLLKKIDIKDRRVIAGGKIGGDVAIIDYPDRFLAVKTDPITLTGAEIGWYVVNINANDIVTSGALPRFFLVTSLLPEGKTDQKMIDEIFSQIKRACKKFHITLCGGHTEVTPSLKNPILIGTMLGEGEKKAMVTTQGAKIGDDILLTKGIAVEATSIIVREKEVFLKRKYSKEFLKRCKNFLYDPGISVVEDALMANKIGGVHSMHDLTEGGIATGLLEVAKASNLGLFVDEEKIKIFHETEVLAKEFNINPLGVIASGALLITCSPEYTQRIIHKLKEKSIECSKIGKMTKESKGMKINRRNGKTTSLPLFERDEIVKIY